MRKETFKRLDNSVLAYVDGNYQGELRCASDEDASTALIMLEEASLEASASEEYNGCISCVIDDEIANRCNGEWEF